MSEDATCMNILICCQITPCSWFLWFSLLCQVLQYVISFIFFILQMFMPEGECKKVGNIVITWEVAIEKTTSVFFIAIINGIS